MMHGTLLFLLCCLAGCESLSFKNEPSCTVTSRFDFEEKLLEKMVRMELWAETLKTKIQTDLDKFSGELGAMKTAIDTAVIDVGALEEKVATKLVELDNTVQEATNKLKQEMDSYKKNDVVFHVQDVVGQPGPGDAITFKTTLMNTGQAYNMGTGCFTAPTKGTYWFAAHICTNPSTYLSPRIIVKGKLAARGYQYDNSYWQCSTVNAVSVLQPGDDVCLKASTISQSGVVTSGTNYLTNDFMGARVN